MQRKYPYHYFHGLIQRCELAILAYSKHQTYKTLAGITCTCAKSQDGPCQIANAPLITPYRQIHMQPITCDVT